MHRCCNFVKTNAVHTANHVYRQTKVKRPSQLFMHDPWCCDALMFFKISVNEVK